MTFLFEYLRLQGDVDIYDTTFDTKTACAWAGLRPKADVAEDDRDGWTVDCWVRSGIRIVRGHLAFQIITSIT